MAWTGLGEGWKSDRGVNDHQDLAVFEEEEPFQKTLTHNSLSQASFEKWRGEETHG